MIIKYESLLFEVYDTVHGTIHETQYESFEFTIGFNNYDLKQYNST